MQLPDPELAAEVGVVGWCLMFLTAGGVGAISFFLRRITQSMDRMAAAQEATPALVAELRTLFSERMETMAEKLDRSVTLAEEHVRIARMWERTEAPGRSVRDGGVI